MEKQKNFGKFKMKDYEKEIVRALKMRERVWTKDYSGRFKSAENQRSFDIMTELLGILEFAPLVKFEELRLLASSASLVVQSSMFTERPPLDNPAQND